MWYIWLLLAAIFVLPVALRLLVGDEPPRNEVTHEQPGDEEDGRALLRVAA